MIELLKCKIHRATVTDASLHYEGSISISKEIARAAGLYEYQKVTIADINNGNRFDTYVILVDEPKVICLNGAAARLVCVGDLIIIMAYEMVEESSAPSHKPTIVLMGEGNEIIS